MRFTARYHFSIESEAAMQSRNWLTIRADGYHESHKNAFDTPYYADCEIAPRIYAGRIVQVGPTHRVYIDYGRRGRNKSWKLQKCTHVRARPLHAVCVHCIREYVCRGGPHKTARHTSVHDLCDLRCRASCARSLSTDQSGRCCCCSSTETDGGPPAPLPATFATPPRPAVRRCSGKTDMAPACIWICGMRSRINVIRTK